MGRLRDWWDRLTSANEEPSHRSAPPSTRAGQPALPSQPGKELQLQDAPQADRPSRLGEAGFDPYGNDAGFAKPHSWERIDHD
ncbi:MAG TPA: hypothetical protein VF277_08160 [Steroidobacteraceae bacterium]